MGVWGLESQVLEIIHIPPYGISDQGRGVSIRNFSRDMGANVQMSYPESEKNMPNNSLHICCCPVQKFYCHQVNIYALLEFFSFRFFTCHD